MSLTKSNPPPSKIFVTGTAGFIGFHLVLQLLERGDVVVGLDNINNYYDVNLKYGRLAETGISKESKAIYSLDDETGCHGAECKRQQPEVGNKRSETRNPQPQNINPTPDANTKFKYATIYQSTCFKNYTFVRLTLEDRENIQKLFEKEKFDKVVNLAAQAGVRYSIENPWTYLDCNITGFMSILEACRHNKIKHLVYASSSSVYGLNKKMPLSTSDNVDHPISLYAATKKSNELMAHTYSHLYGLPTTGLRFFTVYGPWGRPDMALFLFTKAILEDKPIDVYNHGNMVRDFTYIDDIVEGVIRVTDNIPTLGRKKPDTPNLKPETKNLKSIPSNPSTSPTAPYKLYNIGNSNPVNLMDFIEAIEEALGKKAKKNMLDMQPGDVPYTHSDVSDLAEDLNYKPDTPVKEGVGRFVEWFRAWSREHGA